MKPQEDHKPDEHQPQGNANKKGIKNEDGSYTTDPAGTDPDRYEETFSAPDGKNGGKNYDKKPDNHTSPEERMLNPDKGEDK